MPTVLTVKSTDQLRHDWTKKEIAAIYHQPLLELVFDAAVIHKKYHKTGEVQVSSLVSVKTGGCPEDCAYCPQAARYHTDIKVHKLMEVEEVVKKAINAQAKGVSRMCLGAAWREVRDNGSMLHLRNGYGTTSEKIGRCWIICLQPQYRHFRRTLR